MGMKLVLCVEKPVVVMVMRASRAILHIALDTRAWC